MELTAQTDKHRIKIQLFSRFVEKEKVEVKKEIFAKMCKEGCKNYGKNYSCPPFSPKFEGMIKGKEGLFVILMKCDLAGINSTEYNKVRIANSVLKSRMKKLMRKIKEETGLNFLGTGACSLCKPCRKKLNEKCRYPERREYALESAGVDCNQLALLFNFPLLWYKNKKAPEYTAVVSAVICDRDEAGILQKKLKNLR